jgi:hypothetical protein
LLIFSLRRTEEEEKVGKCDLYYSQCLNGEIKETMPIAVGKGRSARQIELGSWLLDTVTWKQAACSFRWFIMLKVLFAGLL